MSPEDINLAVGKLLASRRRELRLSLAKVSAHCGVSLQQIHKYETGQTPMTVPMLVRLSRRLDVPLSYFFEPLLPGETPAEESALAPGGGALDRHGRMSADSALASSRVG